MLGAAFSAVVTAFTEGVVMALVAALFGQPDFDAIVWTVGEGEVAVGSLLTATVNFLIVATVLFLVLEAASRFPRAEEEIVTTPDSDELVVLREIRDRLGPQR